VPVEGARSPFLVVPVVWYGNPHPTPRRQLMTVMQGATEVTVSDGETRKFRPGDTLLMEDTYGEGHVSRNAGSEPAVQIVAQL
jgi:quercetin dioxygenase-like cupin family protein